MFRLILMLKLAYITMNISVNIRMNMNHHLNFRIHMNIVNLTLEMNIQNNTQVILIFMLYCIMLKYVTLYNNILYR